MPDLNARVVLKDEITPRLMILRVAAVGWRLPEFRAGQYAVLGLPPEAPRCSLSIPEPTVPPANKLIRRAYSMASSSSTHEHVDFYIRLVSSGALTPRLFALNLGDWLWLSPKATGLFTLDQVPKDRNIVMVATGTGLAPYMSMLTTHLDCRGPRHLAILHGADHSWDLGYRSELMAIEHLCPNFTYLATIDRPQDEPVTWSGHTGWVQNLWASGALADIWGFPPTPDGSDVFLCGHPAMIDDMCHVLSEEGFREHTQQYVGQVHVERY